MGGLGYVKIGIGRKNSSVRMDKYMSEESDKANACFRRTQVKPGTMSFSLSPTANEEAAPAMPGLIRTALGERLVSASQTDAYRFCFITDFPMYEIDEETGAYVFTHNPFSMPQGGHAGAVIEQAPLKPFWPISMILSATVWSCPPVPYATTIRKSW